MFSLPLPSLPSFLPDTEESNWRNDYPDEEEWRSESSSEYVAYSDDENNRYTPDRRYCFGEKVAHSCVAEADSTKRLRLAKAHLLG